MTNTVRITGISPDGEHVDIDVEVDEGSVCINGHAVLLYSSSRE